MNFTYSLTLEEARDGLNKLYRKDEKQPLILGSMFLFIAIAQLVVMAVNGFRWQLLLFFFPFLALGIWFLANHWLKVYFISRRSASPDNLYVLTFTPDGYVRPGKGKKVKLHGDDKAHAVETDLTVSLRTDANHMYVIPKKVLQGRRLQDLIDLLNASGCPLKEK